jgi:hypothetical protein
MEASARFLFGLILRLFQYRMNYRKSCSLKNAFKKSYIIKRRIQFMNKKDKKIQEEIIHEANKSLAILGRSFVRHGSGNFICLGSLPKKKALKGKSKKNIKK